MDKIKNNFVVVAVALVIVCIILAGYAASLNAQLSAEKVKTMQLNDQIAGLNAKVSDLQAQLISSTTKANDQATLVSSLQSSIDKLSAESEKLKTAYSDLESKLKEQIPLINVPQPAAN